MAIASLCGIDIWLDLLDSCLSLFVDRRNWGSGQHFRVSFRRASSDSHPRHAIASWGGLQGKHTFAIIEDSRILAHSVRTPRHVVDGVSTVVGRGV